MIQTLKQFRCNCSVYYLNVRNILGVLIAENNKNDYFYLYKSVLYMFMKKIQICWESFTFLGNVVGLTFINIFSVKILI